MPLVGIWRYCEKMKIKYGVNKSQVRVIGAAVMVSFLAAALLPAFTSAVEPTVRRGTSATYGVLAGTTITNTGTTSLSGTAGADIGLSPGTSFTGSASVTNTPGTINLTNAAAATAQLDLTTAYGDVAGATPATVLPTDLVGRTILPGIYNSAAGDFANSGSITFDAGGNANAVFIFQAASTLITSESSTMVLAGGAQACNIYWQVGTSATLGVDSTFIGSIYALTSITATTRAKIYGQLLARNGAVTLDTNIIQNDACITSTPTPAPVAPTPVPIPALPQDSSFTGISTSTCTTSSDYLLYLSGTFTSKIYNISVNGVNSNSTDWNQSETQVALTLPASVRKSFQIVIYNDRVPFMASQTFICEEPIVEVVVATPTPTPTPTPTQTPEPTPTPTPSETPTPIDELKREDNETVTATEDGGRLPDTGSNSFNYLLLGGGLLVLGSSGLLIRRHLAK
jgi:type VI secretion system secreted protein VgrG